MEMEISDCSSAGAGACPQTQMGRFVSAASSPLSAPPLSLGGFACYLQSALSACSRLE